MQSNNPNSLEWLIMQLMEKDLLMVFGKPSVDGDLIKIIEQAKLKHEQEILNAHINGQSEFDEGSRRPINDKLAKMYYNETLKTK